MIKINPGDFLKTNNSDITYEDKKIFLRGVGIGNWLNLEHFMLGIPGTDSQIRACIKKYYGENAQKSFWDSYYKYLIDEKDIEYIKSIGFNSIRLAVNHSLFKPDFLNSTGLREINRILKLCKKYNIFAIIDIHTSPGSQNPDWHSDNTTGRYAFWTDKKSREEIIALWEKISDYYKSESIIAGYDILNEPCYFEKELDKVLIDFYKRCSQAIRGIDKNHIIFYEGNFYARDFSMFDAIIDDNCIYSFHYYPFLQLPDKLQTKNLKTRIEDKIYEDVTLRHINEVLKKPIWCGETGHPIHQNQSIEALQFFLEILEEKRISWSIWTYKDIGAMGLTYINPVGKWNKLTKKVSEDWLFWDFFSQDSLLSVELENDKMNYYSYLADNTTKAFNIFDNNLKSVPFNKLLEAVMDFDFNNCIVNEPMLKIIKSIINKFLK